MGMPSGHRGKELRKAFLNRYYLLATRYSRWLRVQYQRICSILLCWVRVVIQEHQSRHRRAFRMGLEHPFHKILRLLVLSRLLPRQMSNVRRELPNEPMGIRALRVMARAMLMMTIKTQATLQAMETAQSGSDQRRTLRVMASKEVLCGKTATGQEWSELEVDNRPSFRCTIFEIPTLT